MLQLRRPLGRSATHTQALPGMPRPLLAHTPTHPVQISGTIRHQDLEGGFWGIESDDGQAYRPVDALPRRFQKDGLRVQATVMPVSTLSIAMWGRSVEVQSIEAL